LKRVLLIRCDDLISGGIASLLKRAPDINLLNITINDIPHLINKINEFCPSILVLKSNLKFIAPSSMIDLLSKFPNLRILLIDESKNIIHVYEKQEVQVTQSTDLLGLVRNTLISKF